MALNRLAAEIITGGDGALEPNQPPVPGRPETFAGVEDDPQTLVRAWDPSSGTLKRVYIGLGRKVNSLAMTPDGRLLAAAKARDIDERKDAYVVIWNAATGQMMAASNYGQGFADSLAFSPDRRQLAVGTGPEIQVIALSTTLLK
jgi:WD40 repeat protein